MSAERKSEPPAAALNNSGVAEGASCDVRTPNLPLLCCVATVTYTVTHKRIMNSYVYWRKHRRVECVYDIGRIALWNIIEGVPMIPGMSSRLTLSLNQMRFMEIDGCRDGWMCGRFMM